MDDKKKILIIEDEKDTLELLKTALERKDFIVITATDGNAGIEAAKLETPDLILMDIMMPTMDGYTCLKEIRKSDKIKNTPVVILSGKEEERLRDLFTFQKISAYIEKPFELDRLIFEIEEILKNL